MTLSSSSCSWRPWGLCEGAGGAQRHGVLLLQQWHQREEVDGDRGVRPGLLWPHQLHLQHSYFPQQPRCVSQTSKNQFADFNDYLNALFKCIGAVGSIWEWRSRKELWKRIIKKTCLHHREVLHLTHLWLIPWTNHWTDALIGQKSKLAHMEAGTVKLETHILTAHFTH